MRSDTDRRSGWGHGTFDALIAALRRDASDAVVKERLESLARKGIPSAAIVDKVRLTHGARGAARVAQLTGEEGIVLPSAAPPARAAYRPTRRGRLKRRLSHLGEDLESRLGRLGRRIEALLGIRGSAARASKRGRRH